MFHIFINENQIDGEKIIIDKNNDPDNFKHLKNAVRIKLNEKLLISINDYIHSFDYLCSVIDIDDENIVAKIEEKTESRELKYNINLYQGFPKADKFEFIIEKAVELGVHSIIPVDMQYSVAKLNEKKESAKLERFNKISKSASEQSKRNIIPEVKNPINYKTMIDSIKNDRYNILFYENANGISETKKYIHDILADISESDNINIIIGPEGGFSEAEIELARSNNVKILSLGDRILRTETAAITSLSILTYELS